MEKMKQLKEKVYEKLKNINPDVVLEKFLDWFDSNKRIAFLITLLVGIITHITMLTEMVMSQDGLWNSIQYYRPGQWEMTLGRWGIALIERLNFFIAVPTISTISCIVCMAISAVFLVDIFKFKSKISVIFTALILALTPTLTATLIYIYTALAYCANFLIAILAVWFLFRFRYKKIGFILASLCFMLTLSIYQSYMGVTIGLCVMITVLELIKNEKNMKQIIIDLLKAVLVVIIGTVIYYGITQIIVQKYGLAFANYQNFNESLNINSVLSNLGISIINAYKDFFAFFLGDTIVHNTNYRRELFYGAFLIVSTFIAIIGIFSIKEDDQKKKIIRCVLTMLFFSAIPLALNIVDVIVVNYALYTLTAAQMILIIPFVFAVFESVNKGIIFKWIAIICCLYIMATYYIANNTTYAAMKLTYNQAYSTTIRVMDRIENTPGYKKEYPILFGGIVGNYNFPRTSSLYTYTIGSITTNPTFHGSYDGAAGTWIKFIQIFLGLDVNVCSPESYYNIVNSEIYKEMDMFPGEDSVRIIDGIVVVKFHEDIAMPY